MPHLESKTKLIMTVSVNKYIIFFELEAKSEKSTFPQIHTKKSVEGISRLKKYNIYIVYNYIYPNTP